MEFLLEECIFNKEIWNCVLLVCLSLCLCICLSVCLSVCLPFSHCLSLMLFLSLSYLLVKLYSFTSFIVSSYTFIFLYSSINIRIRKTKQGMLWQIVQLTKYGTNCFLLDRRWLSIKGIATVPSELILSIAIEHKQYKPLLSAPFLMEKKPYLYQCSYSTNEQFLFYLYHSC